MSWDNSVSPIDAKNSIGFFCIIFLGYPGLVGDSVQNWPTIKAVCIQFFEPVITGWFAFHILEFYYHFGIPQVCKVKFIFT